jgi:hypothetical protein
MKCETPNCPNERKPTLNSRFCASCARERDNARNRRWREKAHACAHPGCGGYTSKPNDKYCPTHRMLQRIERHDIPGAERIAAEYGLKMPTIVKGQPGRKKAEGPKVAPSKPGAGVASLKTGNDKQARLNLRVKKMERVEILRKFGDDEGARALHEAWFTTPYRENPQPAKIGGYNPRTT